jgi:hypothetical protein
MKKFMARHPIVGRACWVTIGAGLMAIAACAVYLVDRLLSEILTKL